MDFIRDERLHGGNCTNKRSFAMVPNLIRDHRECEIPVQGLPTPN